MHTLRHPTRSFLFANHSLPLSFPNVVLHVKKGKYRVRALVRKPDSPEGKALADKGAEVFKCKFPAYAFGATSGLPFHFGACAILGIPNFLFPLRQPEEAQTFGKGIYQILCSLCGNWFLWKRRTCRPWTRKGWRNVDGWRSARSGRTAFHLEVRTNLLPYLAKNELNIVTHRSQNSSLPNVLELSCGALNVPHMTCKNLVERHVLGRFEGFVTFVYAGLSFFPFFKLL